MAVEVNDEVYFRHATGPMAGVIRSHGQHGAQIDCDGVIHKVKWDNVLGHKKRVGYAARVLDQGEDGAIVQRENGQAFYLEGEIPGGHPAPKRPSQSRPVLPRLERLTKAENCGMFLFFKADKHNAETLAKADIASGPSRPGLTQKVITHKDGRQVKHWVRTTDPGGAGAFGNHNIYHGDHVHYQGENHGHVTARGKDGVTVKHAKTGNSHSVGYHEIKSIEQAEAKKKEKDKEKPKEPEKAE